MDPENNMIDNMMGEHPFGSGIVGELANAKRKGVNSFSDISNKMRWEARRLEQIAKKYIPKAFPLSPPKGSSDGNYSHTTYEYLGAKFFTEINDGLFAIDTIKEIFSIGEGLQLILNSLFPNSFDTGSWEMEIPDQFEQAKNTLNEGMTKIKECLDELKESMDSTPSYTVDLIEIEKLKKHAIRLSYDYVKTGTVPTELLERNELAITPESISRERTKLSEMMQQVPMDMTSLLLDSGDENEEPGNGQPERQPSLISDDIFKRFKTFESGR